MGTMAANPPSFSRYILHSFASNVVLIPALASRETEMRGLRDGGSIPDVVQSEFGSTVVTRQPDTHAALPSGEKLPFVGSDEGLRRHLLVGLEVVAVGADVT